jgi:nucleoside-diphosphate-sugar epimerase
VGERSGSTSSQLSESLGGTMKNIVVLGCGYLGYHIAQYFNEQRQTVIVIGKSSVYTKKLNQTIKFIESDIYDTTSYKYFLNDKCTVFFAAGTLNATHPFSQISLDIQQNYIKFIELLNILESQKIQQFIFLSSAGTVYGDKSGKYTETDILEPINIYGLQKMYFENIIRIKHVQNNAFPFLIFRVSNPYGGYQDPAKSQGIIPILINKSIKQQPIDIWVDLSTRRDYVYITDMLNLIYAMTQIEEGKNEVYNLASGVSNTLQEVIEEVEKYTQLTVKINYKSMEILTIKSTEFDNSKLIRVAKTAPAVSLSDGVSMLTRSIKESY